MKYSVYNRRKTMVSMHNPDVDCGHSTVPIFEVFGEIKTVSESKKASWGGMTPKAYSRLVHGETKVDIEHIEGLSNIMYNLGFAGQDSGNEDDFVAYELLMNMLPKPMHRFIRNLDAERSTERRKEFSLRWKRLKSKEFSPVKYCMLELENGSELTACSSLNEGEHVFSGRKRGESRDSKIFGISNMIQHMKDGGTIRAKSIEMGVTSSVYAIGSKCKAADNSKVVHLAKLLFSGERVQLI